MKYPLPCLIKQKANKMKTSKEIQGGLKLKRRLQNTILGQKGYVQFF